MATLQLRVCYDTVISWKSCCAQKGTCLPRRPFGKLLITFAPLTAMLTLQSANVKHVSRKQHAGSKQGSVGMACMWDRHAHLRQQSLETLVTCKSKTQITQASRQTCLPMAQRLHFDTQRHLKRHRRILRAFESCTLRCALARNVRDLFASLERGTRVRCRSSTPRRALLKRLLLLTMALGLVGNALHIVGTVTHAKWAFTRE